MAKLSGVSKTWLYGQTEIKEIIKSCRSDHGKIKRVIDLQDRLTASKSENAVLKEKNKNLKITIKKLRQQLEVVYGELYKLKINV